MRPHSIILLLAFATIPASVAATAPSRSFFDEIKGSNLDVVLSSEEFSHALHYEPEKFRKLVDQIASLCPRIVIVIYLRRQRSSRSNYFERLKSGFALTFEEYAMKQL